MDAAQIVASGMTVSDKIRALNRLNYPRAEIARLLGKRYQHVRNVLEADKTVLAAETPGVEETSSPYSGGDSQSLLTVQTVTLPGEPPTFRLAIGPGGEIRLPAEALESLRLRPGGVAIAELRDGALVVLSLGETIRRLQDWAAKFTTPGRSYVDELIAERRREAAREWGDPDATGRQSD
jgi:hypothetical protein